MKIFSYTSPRENIFTYESWLLEVLPGSWEEKKIRQWKKQGKGLIAEIEGISDRDMAATHVGQNIGVKRSAMPELASDEYYWCDLLGLEVINQEQEVLGRISEIRETGANDVLVVEGEARFLVPMLKGSVIKSVDLEKRQMLVDWDGEYL